MGYDLYRQTAEGTDDGGGEDDYFRLNIWGMSEARSVLADIGIVRWADSSPVPHGEDFGLTQEEVPDDDPRMVAYEAAIAHWREGTQEAVGIPSYKFGSNDGWLVRPLEVTSGVRFADANHPGWRERLEDYIAEFVTWMEAGAAQGRSFRVW